MDKNLKIDLDAVNGSVNILEEELSNLNASYERVKTITGNLNDAWTGQKTDKIYSEVNSFYSSMKKIEDSIKKIKDAVAMYGKNVATADSSVDLNTNNN